jgi:hypothetical protein
MCFKQIYTYVYLHIDMHTLYQVSEANIANGNEGMFFLQFFGPLEGSLPLLLPFWLVCIFHVSVTHMF